MISIQEFESTLFNKSQLLFWIIFLILGRIKKFSSQKFNEIESIHHRRFPKTSRLAECGVIHYFVNHSQEFVSSQFSHIHTNAIERLWKTMKTDSKKNITQGNLKVISRFYFHRNLTHNDQIKFRIDCLKK